MDLNLCGTDSNGNHLYFEKFPINYIEFSSNSNPCISKEKYKVQIDCSTYLYYDIILIYNDFKLLYFLIIKIYLKLKYYLNKINNSDY